MNSHDSTSAADAEYRAWMIDNLHLAADHFSVKVSGEPHHGWRERSISAPVTCDHNDLWLRVVSEEQQWASGYHWTGNLDANNVTGVPRPSVLDSWEWDEWRRQRADLMTRLPGRPCSPTDVLHDAIDLSDAWWDRLRQAIDTVANTPTNRVNISPRRLANRMNGRYGPQADAHAPEWETVHGDLHWGNLLDPFGIVDWELWGTGPAGTDAATLYAYSLLVPDVAERVHDIFADILDTDTGRFAKLQVAARLMGRIDGGDHPELRDPLSDLIEDLLP
jgi:hypothetical protein